MLLTVQHFILVLYPLYSIFIIPICYINSKSSNNSIEACTACNADAKENICKESSDEGVISDWAYISYVTLFFFLTAVSIYITWLHSVEGPTMPVTMRQCASMEESGEIVFFFIF